MQNSPGTKIKGCSKAGRNREKCKKYRLRIGKPNGPGQPGNKAGKNKF